MDRNNEEYPATARPHGGRQGGRGRLVRWCVLAVLVAVVILVQAVPGWGDVYARHVYPVVGELLSDVSGPVPFAVGDLFIALSLAGVAAWPFYVRYVRKGRWRTGLAGAAEYVVWVYVWFYLAWGLNYAQSGFYRRTGIAPAEYTEADFRDFARRYVERLNAEYTPHTAVNADVLRREVVVAYRELSPGLGIHPPFDDRPQAKTMLFSPLASMVGVKGSMGPFFGEFTINGDVPPGEYPATYAHELAHLLGVTDEGEANFYACLACLRTSIRAIRFSGLMSILPHVLNNAYRLLAPAEYDALCRDIRPEVLRLARESQSYWQAKYNRLVGDAQSKVYELYLRGNRVEGGQRSYSQVVGLLIAYGKSHAQAGGGGR